MLGKIEGPQYALKLCGSTYMGIFFSIALHDLQLVESSM